MTLSIDAEMAEVETVTLHRRRHVALAVRRWCEAGSTLIPGVRPQANVLGVFSFDKSQTLECWTFSTVPAGSRYGRYRGAIADIGGSAQNDTNDPYRPFALRHRCDAAWAACIYPDHLLNHLVGVCAQPH